MKAAMRTALPLSTGSAGPLAVLRARWLALSPRERHLSSLAAAAAGLLLVWWIAIAPALATLARAEVRRTALEAQQRHMQVLQAEAQRLQAQPKIGYDESLRALQAAVQQGLGGTAQINVSGDRAIVTLRATPASTLAAWLGQVRANAHAVPLEARLTRSPARATGNTPGAGGMTAPRLAPAATAPDFSQNAPVPAAVSLPGAEPDVRWDGTLVLGLPAR